MHLKKEVKKGVEIALHSHAGSKAFLSALDSKLVCYFLSPLESLLLSALSFPPELPSALVTAKYCSLIQLEVGMTSSLCDSHNISTVLAYKGPGDFYCLHLLTIPFLCLFTG